MGPGLGQTGPVEPKWAAVSAYCKRHGVNRGPVQCRKRWSNLAGDYKKIKEWERGDKNESFWAMRNDLRREKRLPGFFDREVYDIIDGGGGIGGGKMEIMEDEEEEEEEKDKEREGEGEGDPEAEERVFDSGKKDSLFEDEDEAVEETVERVDVPIAQLVSAAVPISGQRSLASISKLTVYLILYARHANYTIISYTPSLYVLHTSCTIYMSVFA